MQIGMLAGALAIVPAYSQTTPANPPATGSAANSGQTVPGTDMNSPSRNGRTDDRGFNFGWLGLVGLAGLLGLRRHNTRYDDTRNINNTGPGGIR